MKISGPTCADVQSCERILRALPDWFGIESAIVQYVKDLEDMPTFSASVGGSIVGFLAINRHTPVSAEIHVIGVLPEHHGKGIGTALVDAAERHLKQDGVELFEVKTLGESRPDENYARTRGFYMARGFRPLEEIPDFWGKDLPALFLVKPLAPRDDWTPRSQS